MIAIYFYPAMSCVCNLLSHSLTLLSCGYYWLLLFLKLLEWCQKEENFWGVIMLFEKEGELLYALLLIAICLHVFTCVFSWYLCLFTILTWSGLSFKKWKECLSKVSLVLIISHLLLCTLNHLSMHIHKFDQTSMKMLMNKSRRQIWSIRSMNKCLRLKKLFVVVFLKYL